MSYTDDLFCMTYTFPNDYKFIADWIDDIPPYKHSRIINLHIEISYVK